MGLNPGYLLKSFLLYGLISLIQKTLEKRVVMINANIIIDNPNSRMSTNNRKNVPTLPLLLSKTIRCISIVPIRDTIDTITE